MNGCRSVEYFYSTPWVETHHRIIQKPSPISLLKSDVDFALTCFEASLFEDFFFSSRNKWLTQMESSSFSSPFKDIERGLAKEMWTSKTIRKQTHGDYSYVAEIQYKQDHVLHDLADRVAAMEIALNKLTKSPIPSPNSTINKSFKKEWQTENGGKAKFSYKYEAKSPEEGEVKTLKTEKFKLSKSAKAKESQIRIIPVEEEDANNNMDAEASRKIQVVHSCEYHVCTISGSLIGFIVVLLVWPPKDFFKFTVEQIGIGGSFLRISCVHNIWLAYRIYCGWPPKDFFKFTVEQIGTVILTKTIRRKMKSVCRGMCLHQWQESLCVKRIFLYEATSIRPKMGVRLYNDKVLKAACRNYKKKSGFSRTRKSKERRCVCVVYLVVGVVDLILLQRSLIKRAREGKVRHCVCVACLRVGVLDLILLQHSLTKRVMKTRNSIVLPPVGVTITMPRLQREEEFKWSQFIVNILHCCHPRPPKPVIAEMLIERLLLPSTCALYLLKFRMVGPHSRGFGLAYDSKEDAQKYEPPHKLRKMGITIEKETPGKGHKKRAKKNPQACNNKF